MATTRFAPLALSLLLLAVVAGCDDGASNEELDTIGVPDTTADTGAGDLANEMDITPDADVDMRECASISVTGEWELAEDTSVSVGYASPTADTPAFARSGLTLLFERYSPLPDVGTFELGPDTADENFGNCAHCLYMTTEVPLVAFYADRGTLINVRDPYSQRVESTVTNLRLIEVDVDPETRSSTPIEGGRCIEVADFAIDDVFPDAGWTCDKELFNDDEACHCTCGPFDPDCGTDTACPPFDPMCPPVEGPYPTVDCAASEFCGFDPVTAQSACLSGCSWLDRTTCDAGTCVYDFGAEGRDTCIEGGERFDTAQLEEQCTKQGNLQYFCAVQDGFALGWCDFDNVCQPVCSDDSECPDPDETCRKFLPPDGELGYCGPEPPEDG